MKRDELLGTWTLDSFELRDQAGKVVRPHGGEESGIIIYAADGYMAVEVAYRRSGANSAEGSFTSYSGTWEIAEGRVLHHVRWSSNPALVGTVQKRTPSIEGDRLTLEAFPSLAAGPGMTALIRWRRPGKRE